LNKLWIVALAVISATVVAQGTQPVVVTSAWVRALPPGQPNTAAYMTITNPGRDAVTIVAANSTLAQKVEFHTTREVDGLQRMEQVEQIVLLPGQVVELVPGKMHLMLLGLDHMPGAGDSVQLCLQLSNGHQACTIADVRKSAGPQQPHQHHHHD
jgi:periplasmic copper chaperone A